MSGPGALAITGAVLWFATMIAGTNAMLAVRRDDARRNELIAWATFAAGAACVIGSVWWWAA